MIASCAQAAKYKAKQEAKQEELAGKGVPAPPPYA